METEEWRVLDGHVTLLNSDDVCRSMIRIKEFNTVCVFIKEWFLSTSCFGGFVVLTGLKSASVKSKGDDTSACLMLC